MRYAIVRITFVGDPLLRGANKQLSAPEVCMLVGSQAGRVGHAGVVRKAFHAVRALYRERALGSFTSRQAI
jgi:hypothetical protein